MKRDRHGFARDIEAARQDLKEYIADLSDESKAHCIQFAQNPNMPKGLPRDYYEIITIGYVRALVDIKHYLEKRMTPTTKEETE